RRTFSRMDMARPGRRARSGSSERAANASCSSDGGRLMSRRTIVRFALVASFGAAICGARAASADTPAIGSKESVSAAHGLTVTVRMMSPTMQAADLQIISLFKHKAGGDTYIEALKDFDDKLGGLLSNLRNRGEFVGELGETILFETPPHSIT